MKSDVIIIGSGPVGASCARNLAEKGLNVLMLEAGEPVSTPPGSHLRNQPKYQTDPDEFFTEVSKWCHRYRETGEPYELPGANVTKAYGGQGLLWTNNCPRPATHELPSCYSFEEWDALYRKAEHYLQVNEGLFDDSIRQNHLIETLSPLLAKQQRTIEKIPLAAERINENTLNFTATHDILNFPPSVSERITIKCGQKVKRLLLKNDYVYGLEIENQLEQYEAGVVIVAGGVFDSTQLLYDSDIRPKALGHYLQFHPLLIAQLVLKDELSLFENHYDQPPRTCIYPTKEYPWHAMILRDIFPKVSSTKVNNNRLIDLQFFVPIEVQERNRMILSAGLPRFDVHLSALDEKILKAARADLVEIGKYLGGFRDGAEPKLLDYGFTHPMGLCCLGDEPQTSVTDRYGKVHGIQNLYLATVGLIPNTMAVNPTLTAVALSIATGNHIAAKSQ